MEEQIEEIEKKVDQTLKIIHHAQTLLQAMRQDLDGFLKKKKVTLPKHLEGLDFRITRLRDSLDDFISGG